MSTGARTVTNSLVCECTISRPVILTFMQHAQDTSCHNMCMPALTFYIILCDTMSELRAKTCGVWPAPGPRRPRASTRSGGAGLLPLPEVEVPSAGKPQMRIPDTDMDHALSLRPSPTPRHAACVDKTRYMKTVYAAAVTATALTRCSERVHLSTLTARLRVSTESSLSPNSSRQGAKGLSSVLLIAKTASPPQHQPPWTMTARDTHLGRTSPLPYAAILCTRIHLARLSMLKIVFTWSHPCPRAHNV